MLYFVNDYSEGAHERILEMLVQTNLESQAGYGFDAYSESAKKRVRRECSAPEADVFFISGGTQTNAVVISALLQGWEGVVSAESGHINSHEAGAIEYTGHKVMSLPSHLGKIDADELSAFLRTYAEDGNREHMVSPGMVYISHPTEYGTIYSKSELTRLSEICREYEIPLYMDGARLGYGLMCKESDLTHPDIAALCDAFYIGGTKVGALCGEAVVFPRGNAPKRFFTTVKQHGALLAKGRLLGIQFDVLFSDGLYFEISKNAAEKGERLKRILQDKGYSFYIDSPTNQQFIVLEDTELEAIEKEVAFSFWEKLDENHTVIRLAVSWATTDESLDALDRILPDHRF